MVANDNDAVIRTGWPTSLHHHDEGGAFHSRLDGSSSSPSCVLYGGIQGDYDCFVDDDDYCYLFRVIIRRSVLSRAYLVS